MLRLVAQSCPTLCKATDCSPPGSSVHGILQDKSTGVGCHALLQGIFPTQGSNPGLSHYEQILYHLSHQRSPLILQWVAIPFSRGSSQPRDQAEVSWIAGRFFTSWATREVWLWWLQEGFSRPQATTLPLHLQNLGAESWKRSRGGEEGRGSGGQDSEITSVETGS